MRRCEDNIRMGLKEIGINTRNWVNQGQDRDYWRTLSECGIEPPGFISHRVSNILDVRLLNSIVKLLPTDSKVLGLNSDSVVGFLSS